MVHVDPHNSASLHSDLVCSLQFTTFIITWCTYLKTHDIQKFIRFMSHSVMSSKVKILLQSPRERVYFVKLFGAGKILLSEVKFCCLQNCHGLGLVLRKKVKQAHNELLCDKINYSVLINYFVL